MAIEIPAQMQARFSLLCQAVRSHQLGLIQTRRKDTNENVLLLVITLETEDGGIQISPVGELLAGPFDDLYHPPPQTQSLVH